MVIFLIVLAAGIVFIGWQLYQKKVAKDATKEAVLNTGAIVPKAPNPSGVPPVATAPTGVDPTVTGIVLGTALESLIGGKPAANGPASSFDATTLYRHDFSIDTDRVTYVFPAGISVYTMPTNGGSVYNLEIVPSNEGYGSGFVKASGIKTPIINGGANLRFQAQGDSVDVTVNCDKSGFIRRF